jgi:Ca2+-binding EF-hand superfamily protein
MKFLKIVFAFALLASFMAHAQTPTPANKPKLDFKKVDANNDGKINLKEAMAAGMSEADFKKADKNNDGYIDPKELAWAIE